jgi:uncharacterized protein (TIGR02722 family)
MFSKIFPLVIIVALTGCVAQPNTVLIDEKADHSAVGVGLDMRDFERAADDAVHSMLSSAAMTKPSGGRWVMAISRMTNDTMQRIDTDLLVKKIRVELLNSGKVVMTTAVGAVVEDPLAMQTRELRGSREFNQAQVAKTGQMIAPDLSLSGKIIQQNARLGDGSVRVEYSFQLAVSDIRTGLAIWEGEKPISKLTTSGVTW